MTAEHAGRQSLGGEPAFEITRRGLGHHHREAWTETPALLEQQIHFRMCTERDHLETGRM